MPAGSMAWGFSTNTCLPAWIAAIMCIGWNFAALAMITTSEAAMTLLVAFETAEAIFVLRRDLIGKLHAQGVALFLRAVHEHVGDRNQPHAFVGEQRLPGTFRSAASATDESQPDNIAPGRVGALRDG